MNLQLPLSEEEFDELQAFLESDNAPESCFDISALDGFLTALICSPKTALPSKWLPMVWGDDEGPEFESEKQAGRIMELLFRMLNGINVALMGGEGLFEPILYQQKHGGKTYRIADAWCYGFMSCLIWRHEEWQAIFEDDEAAANLAPIIALSGGAKAKMFQDIVDTPKKREKLIDLIPYCVEEIYKFWEKERKARPRGISNDTIFLPGKKPGRNELCPCGSGKKFKKCCGNPQKN